MHISTLLPMLAGTPVMSILLYATAYDGTVSAMSLTDGGNGNYSFEKNSSLTACGSSPSWLTYTPDLLYCSDEGSPGSLSTFTFDSAGKLTEAAKVSTTGGDVSNALYGDGKYIAIAHYGFGEISTFTLPIDNNSQALQKLDYPLAQPGPDPSRQDKSYPHQVITDPTGKYIVSPDLGADLVRVFEIDASNGNLTKLDDIKVAPGSGPRHVAFYQATNDSTYMYLTSELASTLTGFQVTYPVGKPPTFTQFIDPFSTTPKNANTESEFIAEVRVSGNTLTVSNRNDSSFGTGKDSLAVYTIGGNGKLANMNAYSSDGSFPRTFEINKKGDLVVIGNQNSNSCVVYERDVQTGHFTTEIASVVLSGQVSSVIFAE
ncbi:MAG: hypothetical protein MMC23_004308 [Stictis urceolatum]|nr:hypothetical protein [Stictis urceolata]